MSQDLRNLSLNQTLIMRDYGNVLRKVIVTKLTKTQITVKTRPNDKDYRAEGVEWKFNMKGQKLGEYKSNYMYLTSMTEEEAEEKVNKKYYNRLA